MTEQYIKKVLKYIPSNKKKEVEERIKKDMKSIVNTETTEEEIITVLNALGHPKNIAEKYCDIKHYLIGPDLFTSYLNVLNIVLIIILILGVVLPFYNIFSINTGQDMQTVFFDLLNNIISSLINSLFYGFTIVTLIFAFLEQMNVKPEKEIEFLFNYKNSNVLLHNYSNDKKYIVIKLIITVVFLPLLLLFLYNFKTNGYNLINIEVFNDYMPYLFIYYAFYVVIEFLKIKTKNWNLKLACIDVFVKVCSILLFTSLFFTTNIMNPDLELYLISKGNNVNIQPILLIVLIAIILANIADMIKTVKIGLNNKN